MKLSVYIALLALLVMSGLYTARLQIASFTLISQLEQAGLSGVEIELQQLGIDSVHVSRFQFSIADNEKVFHLKAKNIYVSFNLKELQQGYVDKVSISHLYISYRNTHPQGLNESHKTQFIEPIKIIASLKQALNEYVRFNQFDIKAMDFQDDSIFSAANKKIQINSKRENGVIHAEINLLDKANKNALQRHLVLKKLDRESVYIDFILYDPVKSSSSVVSSIDLNITDDSVEGAYFLNAEKTFFWLKPFAITDSLNIDAAFKGRIKLDLKNEKVINVSLSSHAKKVIYADLTAESVDLHMKLQSQVLNPLDSIKLLSGSSLSVKAVSKNNLFFKLQPVSITGEVKRTPDGLSYQLGLTMSGLFVDDAEQQYHLKNLQLNLHKTANQLNLQGLFLPEDVPGESNGAFSFSMQSDTGTGVSHFVLKPVNPLNLDIDKARLSQLLEKWPYPFDLQAGQVYLTLQGGWSDTAPLNMTAHMKLVNVGGNQGEILFSGLNLEHELQLLPVVTSIQVSDITLDHIDAGVSVDNISLSMDVRESVKGELPVIELKNVRGEIFSGSIFSNDIVYDPNIDKNSFDIKAQNIDLAEIVKTQQFEGLQVSGKIDGTLPVNITRNGVEIEKGFFINNVRSGSIKYNPGMTGDSLKSNPLTGLALDALRNFSYSQLSAEVNFLSDGELAVNLQLQGTSPELDTKRPVHLNINTQQNLYALLKSLRFAEGVSERIDARVRQQYEQTSKDHYPVK